MTQEGAAPQQKDTVVSDEHACDVLVAGSGAGGFATALTALDRGLDVLMVEKDAVFGGTTAYSAGVIWIPGNAHLPPDACKIDARAARVYLAHHLGNRFDADRASRMAELWETEIDHPLMRGALTLGQITLACALGLEALNPDLLWRPGHPLCLVGPLRRPSVVCRDFATSQALNWIGE